MEDNKIRTLRIKIFDNENGCRDAYVQVGSTCKVGYDNDKKPIFKKVEAIEEVEGGFDIYLESGNEVQLWKHEPKNQYTSVEYDID